MCHTKVVGVTQRLHQREELDFVKRWLSFPSHPLITSVVGTQDVNGSLPYVSDFFLKDEAQKNISEYDLCNQTE